MHTRVLGQVDDDRRKGSTNFTIGSEDQSENERLTRSRMKLDLICLRLERETLI